MQKMKYASLVAMLFLLFFVRYKLEKTYHQLFSPFDSKKAFEIVSKKQVNQDDNTKDAHKECPICAAKAGAESLDDDSHSHHHCHHHTHSHEEHSECLMSPLANRHDYDETSQNTHAHEHSHEHEHEHEHEHDHDHNHDHEHEHDHDHDSFDYKEEDAMISDGLILVLQHLGLQQLAANLLWIQMDMDSHAGLMHRVRFALDLIPAIDPHFVDAYLLLAYVYAKEMNDNVKSRETLLWGLQHNPTSKDLLIQLGFQSLSHLKRYGEERYPEEALEAFNKVIVQGDYPPYVERLKARALVLAGRKEEALDFLKQLISSPLREKSQIDLDEILITKISEGNID